MVNYLTQIPWTDADRRQLREMWDAGRPQALIAATLGRSKHSISRMVHTLKLSPRLSPIKRPAVRAAPKPAAPRPLRAGATTLPPLPSLQATHEQAARAANAEPWEPLPWMVKLRCQACGYWFAAPDEGVERCPSCVQRAQRLTRRAGAAARDAA